MVGDDGEFDLMFESFDRANDALIVKMQESEFVSKYLPLLAAEGAKVDIRPWLTAAGGPMMPVDIYAGKDFLFRVPAFNRTVLTRGTRTHVENKINEIASTAILKGRQHHQLGLAYLVNSLSPKMKAHHDQSLLEELKAWNSILTRYGYPCILPEIATPDNGGVATAPTITEDETYEDI